MWTVGLLYDDFAHIIFYILKYIAQEISHKEAKRKQIFTGTEYSTITSFICHFRDISYVFDE